MIALRCLITGHRWHYEAADRPYLPPDSWFRSCRCGRTQLIRQSDASPA